MSSIFSFLRPEAEAPGEEPPAQPVPGEVPTPNAPRAAMVLALTMNSASTPDQALANMLTILEGHLLAVVAGHLPLLPASLPKPSVSVTGVTERPLAIGNRRGMERRGSLAVLALKGGRLEVGVRFQLWTTDPSDADLGIQKLQERLLSAKEDLWAKGFLRVAAEETSPAEHVPALNAWRKTADYEVLYEFHYQDTDGAESIIARIPIDIDNECGESTVVTDEMVRWDNQEALALTMSGASQPSFRVRGLSILAFLAENWNGSEVRLLASVGGTDRERSFTSVREFRDAFELEEEEEEVEGQTQLKTIDLGGNAYLTGRMAFPNPDFPDPIILKGGEDVFEIRYADRRFQPENADETDSVVYLKVLNSH